MLILGQPQVLINRAPKGFGPLAEAETRAALSLAREANKFGWTVTRDLETRPDDVVISELGYRAMVELALRLKNTRDLFWIVRKLRAGSLGEVARAMNKVPWTEILPAGAKCAIQANSVNSLTYNENLIKRVAGETLEKLGFKITEKEDAVQNIDLSLVKNQLTISLSLAGKPLRFRGYKSTFVSLASIREDLAACITQSALDFAKEQSKDYAAKTIFVPFSGSGTLGFEAVLALRNLPLFHFREKFAAMEFICTPEATRNSIKKNLIATVSPDPIDIKMVEIVKDQAHACQQNLEKFILQAKDLGATVTGETTTADFFNNGNNGDTNNGDTHLFNNGDTHLFIPLNPPYGDRIGGDAKSFYKKTGEKLAKQKQEFAGFCLAPDTESAKVFIKNLKPDAEKSYEIDHGGRTVTVVNFWRRQK